jgi:hypothetical protein
MKNLNNRTLFEIEKERKIKASLFKNDYTPRKETVRFELNQDLNSQEKIKRDKFLYGNSVREDLQVDDFFTSKEISSVSKFNDIVNTVKNDFICNYNRISALDDSLENSFRNFLNKSQKFIDEYKRLELEINRELISNTDGSIFTFGITEYFDNEDKVIQDETDALIIDGKVTCKARKYIVQADTNYILNTSSRLRNKAAVVGSDINSPQHILKQDGSYYQHVVYTQSQHEIVDFILDINLNNPLGLDIKVLRLDLLNPGNKTVASIYTASQVDNWEASFEGLTYVNNGTNVFTINKSKVKYVKVVLSKNEADTFIENNYVFNFTIDYIGLIDMQYETTNDSTLVCGPYEIFDIENKPVNFSYATIKSGTCCVIPENTSIEFYLSKDKLNWKHLSFWDQTNSVASFGESVSDLFSLIDDTSSSFIITNKTKLLEYGLSISNNEGILNFYIPEENMEFYKTGSAIIKRCTNQSDNGGWFVDGTNAECSFFINNFDGMYLDFKNQRVTIDNQSKTGKVFLSYGEHNIKIINYQNYTKEQIRNISSEDDLNTLLGDNFTRFLIEGFPYNSNFTGQRKYMGVSDNYGCILKNADPVYFVNQKENNKIYTEVTIPNVGIFFKLNISEVNSLWLGEHFSINALSSKTVSDNKLYIKAILSTNDPNVSPKIDLVQVRVI